MLEKSSRNKIGMKRRQRERGMEQERRMKRTGMERKGFAGGVPKTELPVTSSMGVSAFAGVGW